MFGRFLVAQHILPEVIVWNCSRFELHSPSLKIVKRGANICNLDLLPEDMLIMPVFLRHHREF